MLSFYHNIIWRNNACHKRRTCFANHTTRFECCVKVNYFVNTGWSYKTKTNFKIPRLWAISGKGVRTATDTYLILLDFLIKYDRRRIFVCSPFFSDEHMAILSINIASYMKIVENYNILQLLEFLLAKGRYHIEYHLVWNVYFRVCLISNRTLRTRVLNVWH